MSQRKIIFQMFLTLFLAALFLPCAAQEIKKPVVINFWHLDVRDEYQAVWQDLCDDFTKLHPNVTFHITVFEIITYKSKLSKMMQSGTPPDVFQNWGGGVMNSLVEAGLLKDITAHFEKWPNRVAAADMHSYRGKVYGLPYKIGSVGIWYNKDLLKKVGYYSFPATWTGLLDLVKKLKAESITPIALGEGDKWPGHFWWVYLAMRTGGKTAFDRAYSGAGSFADASWVKAGQLLKELADMLPFQNDFLADNHDASQALLGNGEAAMMLMGHWTPAASAANSRDKRGIGNKMGFANFPAVEDGAGKQTDCMGGGDGLVIGKNAPEEAVEFLKYITSVNVQKKITTSAIGGIPTVPGSETALTDPHMVTVAKMIAEADFFQIYYDQYLPPGIGAIVYDATQGILSGKMTPEKAAQMVDVAYKKVSK